MDIEKLARKLSDLRYDTGYRFENGSVFHKRLSRIDLCAVLTELQERGYTILHNTPHVESPLIYGPQHPENQQAR